MTRRLVLVAIGIVLAVFIGLPLALLASESSAEGLRAGETEALVNTGLLALGSAAVAALTGVPVGWVSASSPSIATIPILAKTRATIRSKSISTTADRWCSTR